MADVIEYTQTKWGKEDPSKVVAEIGQGKALATQALGLSNDVKYRAQVVEAGAVDKLLEFLSQTDKPFEDLVGDYNKSDSTLLQCPSIWINVLNNFCQDGYLQPQSLGQQVQYKIIIKIGPLFQDMCNFEKRELYGSKDIWMKCLMFFCNMLFSLLSSEYKRIGDFLLKQRNLKSFFVRVLFLEIGEPSIVQDMIDYSNNRDTRIPKPDIIGLSQTFCICAMKHVMTKHPNMKIIQQEFGVTPIRPESDIDLVAGIIQLLETNHRDGWYAQGGYAAALSVFLILFDRLKRLHQPFRVDSCSAALVPVATRYLTKYSPLTRDKHFFENMATSIVVIGATMMTRMVQNKQAPIDYHVAKAIEAGLYEFFVDVCDTNDTRLAKPLEGLIRTVVSCLMLEETRGAMSAKGLTIRAKVERVQFRHPVLLQELAAVAQIISNPVLKIPPLPSACEFCQEKLDLSQPKTIKKCPFCKMACYCSVDCQKLNWLLHNPTCEEIRKEPTAKSIDDLHAQGKIIFGKYLSQILLQASLKGYNILDCVIVVDMCEITPLLKTYKPEEYTKMYNVDEENTANTMNILARNKSNGALTASFAGFTSEGLNASLLTLPPSTAPLFPSVRATKDDTQKWVVAQRTVAQSSMKGNLDKMKGRVWQMTLLKTMKP